MNKNGLHFLSVAEQAKLLRDGELSPVELTEAYLERVERLNSRLFAYITVTADIGVGAGAAGGGGNWAWGVSRAAARNSDCGEGPDVDGGDSDDERVVSVAGLRARGGRDGHRANQGSGRGAVGEAEHERIRVRRAVHVSLRTDAESVEYGL